MRKNRLTQSGSRPHGLAASGSLLGLSCLEVELFTGKTHQIRAQMAALGFPLIGDVRYGNKAVNRHFRRRASAPSCCTPAVWSFRLWTGFSPVSVKEASSLRSRKLPAHAQIL